VWGGLLDSVRTGRSVRELETLAARPTAIYHAAMMQGIHTARVARALGEPRRLEILGRLLAGPATVTELVSATDSTQPNVSNHLATLRRERFVRGESTGRQVRYRLAGPSVAQLVEALTTLTSWQTNGPQPSSPLAEARSCYDHLAGRLGVSVLDALVARGGLAPAAPHRVIDLGPRAEEVFGALGVDVATAAKARRHFAFGCLDWTERRVHLGGALGAELLGGAIERGWLAKQRGTRALLMTGAGRRGFGRVLGI
jgi:DNA-binding transcriptional ArsR family regulator